MLTRIAGSHHQFVHPARPGQRVTVVHPKKRPPDWDAPQYHETGRLADPMTFLVAIHKDPDSAYGVSVPDLPGCASAGDTADEALRMAKEAIELHLEGMLDDGLDLPEPTDDIQALRSNPDFADAAFWGAVRVELDWKRPSTSTVVA